MKVIISCLKIVFKQVVNISKHLFPSIPNLQLREEGVEEEGVVRFKKYLGGHPARKRCPNQKDQIGECRGSYHRSASVGCGGLKPEPKGAGHSDSFKIGLDRHSKDQESDGVGEDFPPSFRSSTTRV